MSEERDGITDSNHPDWPKYQAEGHGRTDEQIRADVHQVVQSAGPQHANVDIEIADGVVTVGGELDASDPLLERLRAVPSVKEVRARAS